MERIEVYKLDNSKMQVELLNLGAIIRSIKIRDCNGVMRDVVLGYDDLEQYRENPCFFGAVVGPIANRTSKAKFYIDGQEYRMVPNEGVNNLHSDFEKGIHKSFFSVESGVCNNVIQMVLNRKDMEDGFPGNREIKVTYSLSDSNELSIEYAIKSDKKTAIGLTNHSYFNIGGHDSGSVLGQTLKLKCSYMTPVEDDLIPTGDLRDVKDSPFDFVDGRKISNNLNLFEKDKQIEIAGGLDHNFVRDDGYGTYAPTAWLFDSKTGIELEMSTDLPGVQVYAGSNITKGIGKENVTYDKFSGICLETQFFPNSLNEEAFVKPVIEAGKIFNSKTSYRFIV